MKLNMEVLMLMTFPFKRIMIQIFLAIIALMKSSMRTIKYINGSIENFQVFKIKNIYLIKFHICFKTVFKYFNLEKLKTKVNLGNIIFIKTNN